MSVTCGSVVLATKNLIPLSAVSQHFEHIEVDDTSTSYVCRMRERRALNIESAGLSMVECPFYYTEVDGMGMWVTESCSPLIQPHHPDPFPWSPARRRHPPTIDNSFFVAMQYWWPDNEA